MDGESQPKIGDNINLPEELKSGLPVSDPCPRVGGNFTRQHTFRDP